MPIATTRRRPDSYSPRASLRVALTLLALLGSTPAIAETGPPGNRLYVLDCGAVIFNHPEAYGLTRQEVRNTNMSVACYLVVNPAGTLLYDTGLPDETLGVPFNEAPLSGDPDAPSTAYFMSVETTLESQLAEIGFPAAKIDYLALSHFHRDHVGNANDYAGSTWLVQKADYDEMFGPQVAPGSLNPHYARLRQSEKLLLTGDHDVFGDGSVVLKHTPGHTPGHQSLYVRLAKTGGIVLSGDLYHYPEERALDRMPERERTRETAASRVAIERFLRERGAQLWIGHDINANSKQKKAPQYYD